MSALNQPTAVSSAALVIDESGPALGSLRTTLDDATWGWVGNAVMSLASRLDDDDLLPDDIGRGLLSLKGSRPVRRPLSEFCEFANVSGAGAQFFIYRHPRTRPAKLNRT